MKGSVESNMLFTLTDRDYRHNLEITEIAFGRAKGWKAPPSLPATNAKRLRKGAQATKQSIYPLCRAMDCFASLAMTASRGIPMRFDLVDLQLFVAVAETRSITNGAQCVHLALASASERIKGLEEALGVVLLTRGRRGVELTPAGESLLDHARIVLHNVEAMRGDLAALAPGATATVRFLANTSGRSEYLPKTLAAFLAAHPHISIDVEERESSDIARAIVIGAADLGLAAEHALPDNIERMPFSEDRLVLVTAREDELANRG